MGHLMLIFLTERVHILYHSSVPLQLYNHCYILTITEAQGGQILVKIYICIQIVIAVLNKKKQQQIPNNFLGHPLGRLLWIQKQEDILEDKRKETKNRAKDNCKTSGSHHVRKRVDDITSPTVTYILIILKKPFCLVIWRTAKAKQKLKKITLIRSFLVQCYSSLHT